MSEYLQAENMTDYRSTVVRFIVELSQLTLHKKLEKHLGKIGSEPDSKPEYIRITSQ